MESVYNTQWERQTIYCLYIYVYKWYTWGFIPSKYSYSFHLEILTTMSRCFRYIPLYVFIWFRKKNWFRTVFCFVLFVCYRFVVPIVGFDLVRIRVFMLLFHLILAHKMYCWWLCISIWTHRSIDSIVCIHIWMVVRTNDAIVCVGFSRWTVVMHKQYAVSLIFVVRVSMRYSFCIHFGPLMRMCVSHSGEMNHKIWINSIHF